MSKNNLSAICLFCLFVMNFTQPLLAGSSAFVFTVDTRLAKGGSDTFTIPTYGTGYNYSVDCDNDGGLEAVEQSSNYTCDYTGMGGSGIYIIRIEDAIGDGSGFPRVRFNDLGEANEIIQLNSWGTGLWDSMDSTFRDAINMVVTATDNPQLSNLTSMKSMFHNASLANPDTSDWITTNVTDMSAIFRGAGTANPDVSNWDTANVTDMRSMFYDAASAKPDTSNWNTSKVTNMLYMFAFTDVATPDTSGWDTGEVTNMSLMFYAAAVANPDTSGWDTANVTQMRQMFHAAAKANPDTSGWDTSKVTDMSYMFIGPNMANPVTSSWDITQVTTMESMFQGITLPTASYDAMLVHFNSQAVQSGIEFHGGNSKYCASAERDNLINTHGWIITDGGLDPLCNDIIFRNSFEVPVVLFNAFEKQFTYDFEQLDTVKLDSYPELIAVGFDAEQQKVIKFNVRKSDEQLQIRLSDLDLDAFDGNQWINQDWQNITNLDLTTVTW